MDAVDAKNLAVLSQDTLAALFRVWDRLDRLGERLEARRDAFRRRQIRRQWRLFRLLRKIKTRGMAKEFRKCGKPNCHCKNGALHGPYWVVFTLPRGQKVTKHFLGVSIPGESKLAAAHRFADKLRAFGSPAFQGFK